MTDFIKRTFNGNAQLIIIILSGLGLLGAAISVYANIYSSINENRHDIVALSQKINEFRIVVEKSEEAQRDTNERFRTFVLDSNKHVLDGQREIVKMLVDMARK